MPVYEWLRRIFVSDINYTTQVSELINYWIINIGLLFIAWKTYKNSISKKVELAVQLTYSRNYILDDLYIEIYNYGNEIAKDVFLTCSNCNIIDESNSLLNNNLGFLKPGSSKKINVGYLHHDYIMFFGKDNISKEKFVKEDIKITVHYNKNESKEFKLNNSFLSSLQGLYVGGENPLKNINDSLQAINNTIGCK